MSTQGNRIIAEGQHPDGSWEQDPPSGYAPTRFSIGDAALTVDEVVELRIGSVWALARFRGLANTSTHVVLDLVLGYHGENIDKVVVPIDALFRTSPQPAEAA